MAFYSYIHLELDERAVVGLVILFILEALILWLLLSSARRKRLKRESERLALLATEGHRRLDEVVSNVPGIVWESRLQPGGNQRRETFISQQLKNVLGYSVEEWLATPRFWESTIVSEDLERVRRESDAIFASGRQGSISFQCRKKDGEVIWLESHLAPILDQNGKPVGLRGVTMNVTDRKLVEQSLAESELRYRALVQATPQNVWVTSPGGQFGPLGWQWWEKLTGQTRGEWENLGWLEVIHPDDREFVREGWTTALNSLKPYNAEYRVRTKTGDYGYYSVNAVPVWTKNGELREWVGTMSDVTGRKKEETLLAGHNRVLEMIASDASLKSVLESIVLLVEGQFTGMLCSILLLDEDGIHMRHGSAPSLPDAYVKAIDGLAIGPDVGSCGTAMYSGGTVIVTDILEDPLWDDYRSVAVANGLRACWSTPVSSHDDQVLGSFAVYHRERHVPDADELRLIDIAVYLARVAIERQRTRDALLMSEERFAKAFKANPQPMSITTLDEGRYVDVNESFLAMSGYSLDEVINRTALELNIWETPTDRANWLAILKEQGSVRNRETKFRKKDGSFRVLLSSAELLDLSGERFILIASSDITERKQAEQSLTDLTRRLLSSQDEERRRIARELHDATAQQIGVMLLHLARIEKLSAELGASGRSLIAESINLGEQVLKDIRTLSYVLHPPLLDQAGLATALRWYVKGFSKRSGIKVEFTANRINGNRLPQDVEYSLYRVAQECLTNIRRHANCETASMSLTRTPNAVVMKVRDSGDSQKLSKIKDLESGESVGVGISGMSQRLIQLGGTLRVESGSSGTTVTATVPIKDQVPDDTHSISR